MTVPLRAALYLRVSTARQAEHDVSIPDQKRQGEAYCEARGYQLVETYVEPGASATNDRRPEFQRMIEAGTSRPAPYAGPSCTSGMTMNGVDLGQQNTYMLTLDGVPTGIINAVSPFLKPPPSCSVEDLNGGYRTICIQVQAPKGTQALSLLDGYTSNGTFDLLSFQDAQTLFQDVYSGTTSRLSTWLSTYSNVSLNQLPNPVQVALIDFAFHTSDGTLTASMPSPGGAAYLLATQNWQGLADYFNSLGSNRAKEWAALIQGAINAKLLPQNGPPC